jgi:hypothetical protein
MVVCAACSDPAPTTADATFDATFDATSDASSDASGAAVELGTGGRAWESLPTDGTAQCEVVHGPQGGYHIFGRVRFHDFPADVYVTYRVLTRDGSRLLTDDRDRLRRVTGRGLLQTSAGFESASGELVILQIQGPADVVGQRFRFEVRVQDANGAATLSDAREITIVDNEP